MMKGLLLVSVIITKNEEKNIGKYLEENEIQFNIIAFNLKDSWDIRLFIIGSMMYKSIDKLPQTL